MRLSKKLKKQLKRKILGSMCGVIATVMLIFVSSNLTKSEINMYNNQNQIQMESSWIEKNYTSEGIRLTIFAEDPAGVRNIEVYGNGEHIRGYMYPDYKTQRKEELKLNIPFGETLQISVEVNGNVTSEYSITNTRYISTAEDLVAFRDSVNAGNSYEGKYVELTNSIDLRPVCSEEVGSWEPIGTIETPFAGNFNGNGYSIQNLYYNGGDEVVGLFGVNKGKISNLKLIDARMFNTGNDKEVVMGGIAGINYLIIEDCFITTMSEISVESSSVASAGGIAGYSYGYIANCINMGAVYCNEVGIKSNYAGGIVGVLIKDSQETNVDVSKLAETNLGVIERCRNNGDINGTSKSASGGQCLHLGGIAGNAKEGTIIRKSCNSANVIGTGASTNPSTGGIVGLVGNESIIEDCYNIGIIQYTTSNSTSNISVGGIAGLAYDENISIRNCYNAGSKGPYTTTTSQVKVGAIIGQLKDASNIDNCYGLSGTGMESLYGTSVSGTETNSSMKTEDELKILTPTLGVANWIADMYLINEGFPILKWQVPQYELNVKQTYMKVGEQFKLEIDTSGIPIEIGDITWTSDDESVATIDGNGNVTAVGAGSTTVYATESTYGLKAMAIINVAKANAVAYPQVESGDGYTVVLKEDGTVWTAGLNNLGQLGNGNNLNSNEPVQVKIDEKTYLTNVVKISAGLNHVVALTEDGQVYSWGANTFGQIGINNTEDKCYATKALDLDGESYLNSVVDISAASGMTIFLKEDGTVYTVGYNRFNRLGNGNETHQSIVNEILVEDIVDVSAGLTYGVALKSDGKVWTWGDNRIGELGIGNYTNQSIPQLSVVSDAVEISAAGYTTIIKLATGEVCGVGYCKKGQMPGVTEDYYNTYQLLTLPSEVTGTVKVKKIRNSVNNTILELSDGTVWVSGENVSGQLGTGDTISKNTFVKLKDENLANVQNVINIGRQQQVYDTTMYNLTYIAQDGYVYTAGDNTYAQIGNGTTTNSLYYTQMEAPYLNYKNKEVIVGVNQDYELSKDYFKIENEFNTSIDFVPTEVGDLSYEIDAEETNIQISDTGVVTGLEEGFAKVKVIDNTNGYETYITVKVVEVAGTQIELGGSFSVALREDGTVWTWGSNSCGQLGIGTSGDYKTEPQKVEGLPRIKDIGVGSNHTLVLSEDGELYGWGLSVFNQLPIGAKGEQRSPKKIEGLTNITKIDASDYITVALDTEGKVYVCGKGYGDDIVQLDNIPEKIVDISGDMLLGENGKIYRLDGSMIHNVRNVQKISSYVNQGIAIMGDNSIVRISDAEEITRYNIENPVEASYGNDYGIIMDEAQNVYTFGKNDTCQLGNGNQEEVTEPTKIETINTEIIAASELGHTAIADFEGNIYTVGLNDHGQLGHGNTDTLSNFKQVLNVWGESNVDNIVKKIGESEIVDIGLNSTLNLKKDLTEDAITNITIEDDTIADLEKNPDGTYTVTGKNPGKTVLHATVTDNINEKEYVFEKEVEVKILSLDQNRIKNITVNGYEASLSLTEENTYEIIVTDKTVNEVIVTAEIENALVSINGEEATEGSQTYETSLSEGYVELPIKVTSAEGKEQTSILKIYTPDEMLKLKNVKVNSQDASLEDDGTYKAIIADDISRSGITAECKYDTSLVGINDGVKEVKTITEAVTTTEAQVEAKIQVEATLTIDGQEQTVTKEYTVNVYKNKFFSEVQTVIVNGQKLEEENGNYTAYVLSNEPYVEIYIKTEDNSMLIDLVGGGSAYGTFCEQRGIGEGKTIFEFKVVNPETSETKTYYITVIKGEYDTAIKKITVGKEEYVVEAIKQDEEIDGKKVYEAKILDNYINGDITVQTANKTSKISINNNPRFTTKLALENVDLPERETLIPISVKTDDEATSEEYILRILRQEDVTDLEYITVDELLGGEALEARLEEENNDEQNRYEVYLENATNTVQINAGTLGDYAKISINGEPEEVKDSSIELDLTSGKTEVEIKVTSETGIVKTYYLSVYTISDDTTITTVTVDGVEAEWNDETNRYEIKVDRDLPSYEVKVDTHEPDANINLDGQEGLGTVTKEIINQTEETIVDIVVTAPNKLTSKSCKLAIIEKSNNSNLGYVKVDGEVVEAEDNGNYKVEVPSSVESVLLELGAKNPNATIDLEGEVQTGVWKNTKVLESTEEIYDVVITSEDGVTIQNYTVQIIKVYNTNIDSVTANGAEMTLGEESENILEVSEEATEIIIKSEEADAEIYLLKDGVEIETGVGTLTVEQDIPQEEAAKYTIRVQGPEEYAKYKTEYALNIREKSTNLNSVITLDGETMLLDEETGLYKAEVVGSSHTVEVDTESEFAKVVIDENEAVSKEFEIEAGQTMQISIKVTSENGETEVKTVEIYRKYDNAEIEKVEIALTAEGEAEVLERRADGTYFKKVDITQTSVIVKLTAANAKAIANINGAQNVKEVVATVELSEDVTNIPLKVIAEDGTEKETTLVVDKRSTDASLAEVKVDDVVLEQDETKQYHKEIDKFAEKAKIRVTATNPAAKIQVAGQEAQIGDTGELLVDLNLEQDQIIIPVVVTAPDEVTTENYNIILTRVEFVITGKVITENWEGKHIAQVTVYKTEDTRVEGDDVDPREVVAEVVTNEAGEYQIYLPKEDKYDIVIKKPSYLEYRVTAVDVKKGEYAQIPDITLNAGDTNQSGEIEVYDLVGLNDNIGVVITDENRAQKAIYDLNEDGIVDSADRNILKANYGKLAETVIWSDIYIAPEPEINSVVNIAESSLGVILSTEYEQNVENAAEENGESSETVQTLIVPISAGYQITSEYGDRVHPITGEYKKHTGIDLSGIWHTEILAVADGEVTFAGANEAFGNCVEIKHVVNGETIYSFYAHLSEINVEVGQTVTQGQVIGLEGGAATDPNPGYSTGHHLHFEIRNASGYGNDVDPSLYIKF